MDRYNEVKIFLKNWEQSFVQQQKRKPNKDDIDQAPDETKKLYKEYRSLKQAKETGNRTHEANVHSEQPIPPAETDTGQKNVGCWGAHLNRSKMAMSSSPSLTAQDRDSLQASSQYYGMKLKNNLGTLSKDRPVLLKKSVTPGRTPGKSWKDRLSGQTDSPFAAAKRTTHSPQSTLPVVSPAPLSPFIPRSAKSCSGSIGIQAFCPLEPQELFEPFKPSDTSYDEPAAVTHISASSGDASKIGCGSSTSGSAVSLAKPPPLVLNPAPAGSGYTVNGEPLGCEEGTTGRGSQGPGSSRGGRGGASVPRRPSLLSRLGSVDRGWLQRCQVFREVEEGERPVAGNQEVPADHGGGEGDTGAGGEGRGKTEAETLGTQEPVSTEAREETQVGSSDGGTLPPAPRRKRRSRVNVEEKRMQQEGQQEDGGAGETTAASPHHGDHGDHGDQGPGAPRPRNRGRKRGRDGEEEEQGGAKKRQRNAKKMQADDDDHPTPAKAGEKKKRVKKGDEEDEEQVPKVQNKVVQENLLGEVEEHVGAHRKYHTQSTGTRGNKNSDGNFVKINLKKKSHVKGYALRGVGLRKQMYMQKFQLKGERFSGGFGRGSRGGFRGGFNRQGDTCYKCGGSGHWAIDCRSQAPPPPVSEDEPPAVDQPFELPTLEEVARATGTLRSQHLVAPSSGEDKLHGHEEEVSGRQSDDVLLDVIRPDYERPAAPPPVEPLYGVEDNGKVQATPAEVYAALKDFGYQSFRPGQEDAIMRILSGLSTLVVLSTGMGKSLCYQLPAYLYAQRSKSITLVVSPLVSLMDDQLSGLPGTLKAACIHSNMTMKQRQAAIEKVKAGEVCVLLLSPEALVGGGGSASGCLPPADQLPTVAFACIDEAHCVSEWSHNFRPCYLRLCKVLRERLGVRCLLGLTATATLSTALDIARHLDISHQDGIAVRSTAVPPNLQLSVSTDGEKDQGLVSLLKGDRFGCLDSIIVYCTRREETVRVAALLRTCLQGVVVRQNKHCNPGSQAYSNPVGQKKKDLARKKIRKPLKWQAESYHAGLSASERRRVQNNFMCGELRVVVATVAFGMGLDKSDVRGIIHYNMPKSFESYVQEIGRAGRDGEPAHCHLFLDPDGGDLHELRRHIYADTVDYFTVKKLVQKVFPACKCKQMHQKEQDLAKCADDVDDSEIMEMMDVYEQESTTPPQQHMVQSTHPSSSPAELPSPLAPNTVDEVPLRGIAEEEEEEEAGESPLTGPDVGRLNPAESVGNADWPAERVCHTHERAVPIQQTVDTLDITEEGVETLLCYLELHPQRFVELLHSTMSQCKINCYGGPRQLQIITKICPPIAVVLARKRMAGERVETCDWLEFDVVELADTMGWQLPLVKRGLRQLQWSTERAGGRSGVLVEFSSPSFYFRSYGDLSDDEMDRVCQFLHKRVQDREKTQLYQLKACFQAFKSVAYPSVSSCVDELEDSRSLQLKNHLAEYFDKKRDPDHMKTLEEDEEINKYKLLDWADQISADVRSFLSNRSDEKFSGRAVARIFHGIGSPCYPAQTYGRDRRYWRKYIQFDFNQLIRLATQEIIRFK